MTETDTAQKDYRLRLPALVEYRAQSVKRQAVAFCDAPEFVLGMEVRPLTPATFSMLIATDSAFLRNTAPQERDVRNYLWFHSPLYAHCGVPDWPARKARALRRLTFEMAQPWRRWLGLAPDIHRALAALSIAASEIQQLVDDAFADAPPAGGRSGKALATLEGFFIHEFAVAYAWPPEKTRHTPLRQLVQMHRCIRSARGEEVIDHRETEILCAHLRARAAALASSPQPPPAEAAAA